MSTMGPEERRAKRQVNSARLRPIRSRSRSQSPEKSGDQVTNVKDKEEKKTDTLPQVKTAKTVSINSQVKQKKNGLEKRRRVVRTKMVDREGRQAAAYRKAVGRRNAFDAGARQRCKSSGLEKGRGGKKEVEERSKSSCEGTIKEVKSEGDNRIKNLAKKAGLTSGQIRAFQEVFDLFDSNGGGSIDADELDEALRSVNIELTREEIRDVLKNIDDDGNGEIDFPEFLQLMTNTERFIEALTSDQKREQGSGRETLLFDALTEFMKKSALHSMDEIVGYYSHKYKRTQIPHVVNHYAAGARLIGLSEKQLKEHMESLKANAIATGPDGIISPYAEPLPILHSFTSMPRKHPRPRKLGRIRLYVSLAEQESLKKMKEKRTKDDQYRVQNDQYHVQDEVQAALEVYGRLHHIPVTRRGFGWVNEHINHMEVKLPSAQLRKLRPFSGLTTEDLPAIRTSVSNATRTYTKQRLQTQLRDNLKHWKALQVDLITPKILQSHFKVIYSVYSLVGQKHLKIPGL